MTICLSKEGCNNNDITVAEAFLLLIIHNKYNLGAAQRDLITKGYITAERDENGNSTSGWRVTRTGAEIINHVIADSDKYQRPEDDLNTLAKKLKEIFPKGKKDGTNMYWAEGILLIVRRLKLFFKKYGNEYTEDEIITAAQKYVQSFNGNYQYMKTLKYFIFKEKVGVGKDVEGESELLNYIENAGQEESLRNDWMSNMV